MRVGEGEGKEGECALNAPSSCISVAFFNAPPMHIVRES